MNPIQRPVPFLLSTWILAGAVGFLVGSPSTTEAPLSRAIPSGPLVSTSPPVGTDAPPELPSDSSNVEATPFGIRKSAFQRLANRADRLGSYTPSEQLFILRSVASFSFDEAVEMLEQLLQNQKNSSNTNFARSALTEHLAALDPLRALNRCEEMKNFHGSSIFLEALAKSSPLETLRSLWKQRTWNPGENLEHTSTLGGVLAFFGATIPGNVPAAPFGEIQKLALENPTTTLDGQGSMRMLGAALAHSGLSAPQETLSRVRSLFEQLQNSLPADAGKRLHKLQLESSFNALVEGAYKQIASQSPEAASQYFDALSDSEKTKLTAEEIRNRFSHGGSEAAFNLAEKLQSPTNQITAGQVISHLISEKDKPAMLGWIHSLPDSEFRRGVLRALDSDTGALLQSSKDRIDFFAAKDTRPDEVEKLPLTNEEKALLLQKVAPIPLP